MGIKIKTSQSGFTLIEMMVVLFIFALIIPLIFSILYSVLFAQTKVKRLSEVKREGDYVLSTLTTTVRNNAQSIRTGANCSNTDSSGWANFATTTETCDKNAGAFPASFTSSTDGDDFCFEDKYGKGFKFYLNSGAISSSSASLASNVNLTSTKVDVSNFEISCVRNSVYGNPVVSVSFTVSDASGSTRTEDTATLDYHTSVKLNEY